MLKRVINIINIIFCIVFIVFSLCGKNDLYKFADSLFWLWCGVMLYTNIRMDK